MCKRKLEFGGVASRSPAMRLRRTRVLIVDDHPICRVGIRNSLRASDIEIVGEAADGIAALKAARSLAPDVVVMDVCLPHLDGIAALREIKRLSPAVSVVMVTGFEGREALLRAFQAGAAGFLLKTEAWDRLLQVVRRVAKGETCLDTLEALRLLDKNKPSSRKDPESGRPLSRRETEILQHMCHGLRYAEIADMLGLKLNTVKTFIRRIGQKVGLSKRTELVLWAIRHGLARDSPNSG